MDLQICMLYNMCIIIIIIIVRYYYFSATQIKSHQKVFMFQELPPHIVCMDRMYIITFSCVHGLVPKCSEFINNLFVFQTICFVAKICINGVCI